MTQLDIFKARARAQPRGAGQAAQLERVTTGIGYLVLAFCRDRVGQEFHMGALLAYVNRNAGGYVAPGSPDRILRALRKGGRVDYEVVSRSESLYRIKAVAS